MKVLLLVVNYVFLLIWIFFLYYFFKELETSTIVMAFLFFLSTFSNLIYVYKSIPYDKEKEKLKKQVDALNKKIEQKDKEDTNITNTEIIEEK